MTALAQFFDEYKDAKTNEPGPQDAFVGLVKKRFGGEDGKALLQMLKVGYLEAPVSPLNSPRGYGKYREGQNSIIRLFEQIVKGDITHE